MSDLTSDILDLSAAISTTEEIIEDARNGRMFILVDHEDREIGGGDWEVLFTPQAEAAPVEISVDADRPETWPDPSDHLDLSDLDPPEPMVRILAAVEAMEPGEVLFAVLSREPVFLFPELTRRGHQWAGNFDETGSAYRILVRIGEAKA